MSLMLAAAGSTAPANRYIRSNAGLIALRALIAHLRSQSSRLVDPRDVPGGTLDAMLTPPDARDWAALSLPESKKVVDIYQGVEEGSRNIPEAIVAKYKNWLSLTGLSSMYKVPVHNPHVKPDSSAARHSSGNNVRLIYMYADRFATPGELLITRHLGSGNFLKDPCSKILVGRLTSEGIIMGAIPADNRPVNKSQTGWVARAAAAPKGPKERYLGPTITRIGVGIGPGERPLNFYTKWSRFMGQPLSLKELALIFKTIPRVADFLDLEMENA